MKRILIALCIALALPAFAAAAGKASQKLVLEFVDGSELTLTKPDKSVAKLGSGIFEGDEIPAGSVIATGAGTMAELKLKPNGTIIKIARSTTFKIAALAGPAESKNAFALVAGKVRAVAAKGAEYEMSSRTAVCAVRGTDFAFSVEEGAKAQLMVAKGLVQFDKLDDAGAVLGSIGVAAGQAADAFAATFASFAYSPEQFAEAFGDVGFTKLKESDVPEKAIESDEAPAVTPDVAAAASPEGAAAATEKPAAPAPESALAKWLREALGFEIGSVTIDDKNYSKAVLQPTFAFGKTKLGLYLPIIYTSNLFDPEDWYKPAGNNEWTFGYDEFAKGDYGAGALDAAKDLALKIKYFEYGAQFRDPFYVKMGNLDDLSLGHGLLMRNYANDTDFPSVRRLGFNTGLDLAGGGFELIANDLTAPEIFGTRLFVRPIPGFKLALGAQAVVDWDPAGGTSAFEGDTAALKLIGTGVDLDLPILQGDILGLRLFADGGATLPYTAATYDGVTGLQYQLVYNKATGEFKNWGAAAGLIGNVLFIDWRLEYRYTTGYFKSSLFDSTYDRMRSQYAAQYLEYLQDPSSYASLPDVMGIYGEGGFKILKDKLGLTIGYYWPWSTEAGLDVKQQLYVSSSDELHLKLTLKKGLIPIVDAAGSIYYDKRGLAKSIAENSFSILDQDSVFGGEIDIPVPKTPNLDLAVIFLTEPVLDAAGNITEIKPSISIETRFHF
jgi:hypothetical protein